MKNAVGPVLRMSEDVEAIIRAIEEDNPGTEIEVIDRGAYVRIQGERRLQVTRESIERHIGRAFEMRQLEPMMSAFAGRIDTSSDKVVWEYKREEAHYSPEVLSPVQASDPVREYKQEEEMSS